MVDSIRIEFVYKLTATTTNSADVVDVDFDTALPLNSLSSIKYVVEEDYSRRF
jgi:hypothetical protein